MIAPTFGTAPVTRSSGPRSRRASLVTARAAVDSSTSPETRASAMSGCRMANACMAIPPIE